jgi:hypothetical protein
VLETLFSGLDECRSSTQELGVPPKRPLQKCRKIEHY